MDELTRLQTLRTGYIDAIAEIDQLIATYEPPLEPPQDSVPAHRSAAL